MSRLRSPIRRVGASTERWQRWRQKCRTAVALRAGFRCEGCGSNLRPLEWHHIAGRSHIVAEPFASSPELTVALCSSAHGELGCHEKVTRELDAELRDRLRWLAVNRLMERYRLGFLRGEEGDGPLDVIREALRRIEHDWVFDVHKLEIVSRPYHVDDAQLAEWGLSS